jgi:hypothetical protein
MYNTKKRRITMEKYYNPMYDDICENPIVPDKEEIYSIDEVFLGANQIYRVDRYFAYQGRIVEKWDLKNTLLYSKGKVFLDYLPSGIGWPIVSFKVKEIFDDLHISNVQFLPISIKHKKTGRLNSDYFVLNITKIITDVIDLKQTEHYYVENSKGEMVLWIIDPGPKVLLNKINKFDIFRIEEDWPKIYLSEKLVNEFKERNITGLGYKGVITV